MVEDSWIAKLEILACEEGHVRETPGWILSW